MRPPAVVAACRTESRSAATRAISLRNESISAAEGAAAFARRFVAVSRRATASSSRFAAAATLTGFLARWSAHAYGAASGTVNRRGEAVGTHFELRHYSN